MLASVLTPDVISSVAVFVAVGTVILHLMLAMGVMFEAVALERRRPLWFLGALSWTLVTLITGLLGAGFFWLMHYSTLAGEKLPASRRPWQPDPPREVPLPHRAAK